MASPTDHQINCTTQVPEEYNCTICTKLLHEPMLTDCCGQHFCEQCLENWFEASLGENRTKTCPHCRKVNFRYIKDLPIKRKINNLVIFCPNQKQGCDNFFPLQELHTHLTICEYVFVECPNQCERSLLQKDLQEHCEQSCPRRLVTCVRCGVTSTYIEITTNHLNTSTCPDMHSELTEYQDEIETKYLHFSWKSNTTLCTSSFYLQPGYKVHLQCEVTQEHAQQGARLLTKMANGEISLILERGERDGTLTWPIPNNTEIRLEQFPTSKDKGRSFLFFQMLCSICDPSINLSRVGAGSRERVLCTEKLFGQINFKERIRNGFQAIVTLTKHTCNYSDDEDNGSN